MGSDESSEGGVRPPVLLRGWVLGTVTAAAVLTGVGAWVHSQPTVYTSTAVVAFTPKPNRPVSATVVVLTTPRYVAYTTSPYVLRQVAEPLGVDSVVLQNGVVVTMAAATANISISVTLQNAKTAAAVANAIAAVVLERSQSDPILAAETVSSAVPAPVASGPDRGLVLGAGALGAGVAGGALWLLAERYHRRRSGVVRGVATVSGPMPEPVRKPAPAADLTRELPVLPETTSASK